jgi:hypothetical protein
MKGSLLEILRNTTKVSAIAVLQCTEWQLTEIVCWGCPALSEGTVRAFVWLGWRKSLTFEIISQTLRPNRRCLLCLRQMFPASVTHASFALTDVSCVCDRCLFCLWQIFILSVTHVCFACDMVLVSVTAVCFAYDRYFLCLWQMLVLPATLKFRTQRSQCTILACRCKKYFHLNGVLCHGFAINTNAFHSPCTRVRKNTLRPSTDINCSLKISLGYKQWQTTW